jgi:iron complex outermembrane receptor protein
VPGGAWADYANSFRTKGYATLNLSADVTVGKKTVLFLDARNLTNTRAVGDISAVVDYGTLQSSQQSIFHPIERRSFFGGIRMRW